MPVEGVVGVNTNPVVPVNVAPPAGVVNTPGTLESTNV